MAKLSALTGESLPVAEATLSIRGGTGFPVVNFRMEHNPVGIVPSMAYVTLPVLVDKASLDFLPEYEVKNPKVITGQSNYPNATGKVRASFASGEVSSPSGDAQSYEPVSGDSGDPFLASSALVGSVPKLSDLLSSVVDVTLKSYVGRAENNAKAGGMDVEESSVQIKYLRVRRVTSSNDAPITLNKVVVVQLLLADRRYDWSQMSNFTDDLNIFKGVDASGIPVYENDSIWNPGGTESSRRAWCAKDAVSYMIALIEGNPITGSRASGLDFGVDVAKYLVSDAKLSDQVVENIAGRGSNPSIVLHDMLKRWGLTIIFKHDSTWYIDKTGRSPLYPKKKLRDQAIELVAESSNAESLRAKKLVIHGNPIKVQESFDLEEGVDFDYVVPFEGQWLQLDYVWRSILDQQVPSASGYNDATRNDYLDGEQKLEFARLSSLPIENNDYEAYMGIAGFQNVNVNASAAKVTRLLRAIATVASNGFRYFRLRKDGAYGGFRRPAKDLVSINNIGDSNGPVAIGVGFQQLQIRTATTAEPDPDVADRIKGAFKFVPDATKDSIAGEIVKFDKEVGNVNDFVRVPNFAQGATLEDESALVFSVSHKYIYPSKERDFRPQQYSSSTATRQSSQQKPYEVAGKLIREYTSYDWVRTKSIGLLVASTFAGTAFSKGGIPGGFYYSDYEVEKGRSGTATQYQDHLDLEVVLSRVEFGNDGYSFADAVSGLPRLPIAAGSSVSPMDLLREKAAGTAALLLSKIDTEAERVAAFYFNSARYTVGADYMWAGVVVPSETKGIFYSSQTKTVAWVCDDSGIRTSVRYDSDSPYSPAVGAFRRDYVQFLNQQRQFNDTKALGRLMKQARQSSGGRHDE